MNKQTSILIVDDDEEIRDLISQFLIKYHFKVVGANDGPEMFEQLEQHSIDLIVLDLMLPGEDGISLCRKLQQEKIPVLMMSAAGEETDRIIGLEVGADDFIPKPFNPRELLARIRAVLRRSQSSYTSNEELIRTPIKYLTFNNWKLDINSRQFISPKKVEISLSASEFNLLLTFLEHPQQVLSRDKLLDMTKHRFSDPFDRSIDMQVSRLRHKIEDNPKQPKLIKTVRGGGYLFAAEVKRISV